MMRLIASKAIRSLTVPSGYRTKWTTSTSAYLKSYCHNQRPYEASAPQFETPPTPHPADAQPPADTEGGSAEYQATPLLLGKAVHHIKLNAKRFSSHNTISDQDEEKLLVVVEPLSEQNEYIELSAPMTVLVEDADKEGSSASLGRWEFNALQTGRTLRESKMGRGIHLNLDWPRDLPLVDNLRVSVTYATLDGTQLEAEELLHSDSQKNSIAGWTPAAKSRQQTVVGQPKNDPFMLTEQDQEQSVGAVFKTVPIPAEPTPAINTPVKLVSRDANAASTRQIDGAVIQSVEFDETAIWILLKLFVVARPSRATMKNRPEC